MVTPGITMWEELPSGVYEGDSYNLALRLTPLAEPVNPRVVEVSVSDPSILKVSVEHVEAYWYRYTVEALRPGVAEVVFTEPVSGAKLMKSVTVKERVLEKLQISGPQEIFTDLGKEYKYTVSAFPKGVSAAVEWSVDDSGIGELVRKEDSAVYVRPTASGTLMLKATSIVNPEISVSKKITVSTPVLYLPELVRIEETEKWKYVIIESNAMSVLFEEAYNYPFEIESSDPEVVKASREGGEWNYIRLEPVNPGLAIVTVRYKTGNLQASMKVVVEPYDLSSVENHFGDENKSVDIYNLNGQIIVKGGTLENLTDLPSGLYIVNGKVYLKN